MRKIKTPPVGPAGTRRNKNQGSVWKANDGRLYLQRCPACALENWAPAVATGVCAWCSYKGRVEDVRER